MRLTKEEYKEIKRVENETYNEFLFALLPLDYRSLENKIKEFILKLVPNPINVTVIISDSNKIMVSYYAKEFKLARFSIQF